VGRGDQIGAAFARRLSVDYRSNIGAGEITLLASQCLAIFAQPIDTARGLSSNDPIYSF
jgi:hypothetical protein